jgi:hypothetical protein
MSHDAGAEFEWGQETLRLLFVGLTVWIVGSVTTFALLSGAAGPGQLSSQDMRATVLLVGFALGALALLGYGTLRLLSSGATVLALLAAVGSFLLPPVAAVAWHTAAGGAPATLAPGLLAILVAHAGVTAMRALRSARRPDRVLVPEAALLLLGLGLVLADLGESLAIAGSVQ